MQLEDYFDSEMIETKFGPVERIRVKGHRISIEHVLEYYKEGFSPETIQRDVLPTLSLEKIYATILYYQANREKIEAYLKRTEEIGSQFEKEHDKQGESEAVRRLKQRLAEKRASILAPAEAQTPAAPMVT